MATNPNTLKKTSRGGAILVAAGILLSRIAGLIRERTFAHYFGNSDAGDAFKAALKIPNFLQNLFGEGVLSASFIPVYAGLLSKKQDEDADKVASIIGSLLALLTALLTVIGIIATPWLIKMIAPGFEGAKKELTIRLVQIFFPGTAFLVLSAWCLGILNSHRRFFLSYATPVIWNAVIILSLIFFGSGSAQTDLARIAAWGLVAGSLLQFLLQLPTALSLMNRFRPSFQFTFGPIRTVLRNFFPVVVARGVVQISAYIDNILASLLPTGSVSALAYAQTLYLMPVSLFGMAVSAAELPTLSSAQGTAEEISAFLRQRLTRGLRQIAFFVIPSALVFLALGDVLVSAIFQTGAFTRRDTLLVWAVLGGYGVGLLAATWGRLYASTYYALHDTRTPLKFALARVVLATSLGYWLSIHGPDYLGLDRIWGSIGLTLASGLAAWVEMILLKKRLQEKLGPVRLEISFLGKVWSAALLAGLIGFFIKQAFSSWPPLTLALVVLIPFGTVYFGLNIFWKVPEGQAVLQRFLRTPRTPR